MARRTRSKTVAKKPSKSVQLRRSGSELAERAKSAAIGAGHATLDVLEGFVGLVRGFFTEERVASIKAGASTAGSYAWAGTKAAGSAAYRAGSAGASRLHAYLKGKTVASPAEKELNNAIAVTVVNVPAEPAAPPRMKGILRGGKQIVLR